MNSTDTPPLVHTIAFYILSFAVHMTDSAAWVSTGIWTMWALLVGIRGYRRVTHIILLSAKWMDERTMTNETRLFEPAVVKKGYKSEALSSVSLI